jgi:putative ABC transport system permease protein
MKTSMYFNYPSRALLRGGQRTILAVFCIAVGVMAVVSLQLVSLMLQNSLTANVRDINGGDVAVNSPGAPLKTSDLTFFDQLKRSGTITNYTAVIGASGTLAASDSSIQSFSVEAVDPAHYPLVSPPTFVGSDTATVAQVLVHNQVVVTQHFLDRYQKHFGDTFNVYIKNATGSGETLVVKITGVIANTGSFAQANNLLLIARQDYLAVNPTALTAYSSIYVTTADQAETDVAVRAITKTFPLTAIQTATDALKNEQASVDMISTFLKISGLLALLIGGVGIVNTMQVQLSRRKTEIAMLKTSGYHRRDLFVLFGLEASLLGLIGGIVGAAAAVGVSAIVRGLMENFGINVLFVLNPWTIASGMLIGCATALIFGLMPIVQAANIRPLQVIREIDNKRTSSRILTIVLLVILSLLFCLLAGNILNNDVVLGIETTYGTFASLLLLGAFFSLIIFAVSKLPVPEHLHLKHIVLVLAGVVISVGVYLVLPVFGIFLLAISLFGILITFLPKSWKVSIKMALHNIGRQRTRTITTMVALFISIFGIGLVIGLEQDTQTQITEALTQNQQYNIVATASGKGKTSLHENLHTIPGLMNSREDPFVVSLPIAINGQPAQQVIPTGSGGQQTMSVLSGIEGYNLVQNVPAQKIIQGRNLLPSDANSNNVIIAQMLTSSGWFGMKLKPGDTITFASADRKILKTVTVVGVISNSTSFETLGKILAPASVITALNAGQTTNTTVFYMNVSSAQVNHALDTLNRIAPDAAVQNLSDMGTAFLQQLSSIMDMVIAVASLSMLASVIIIANSVSLAMLERKRELGILKSVGYTSGSVLRSVLIENGIIGGVGAFIAVLLSAGGVTMFGTVASGGVKISMEPVVVISLVAVPTLLAMLTAALVTWRSVRVRPLIVLKYE